MENPYKIESFIEGVDFKTVESEEWVHGTALLASNSVPKHPEIIAAYGFKDGEKTAKAITQMKQETEDGTYFFDVNKMYVNDKGLYIKRFRFVEE